MESTSMDGLTSIAAERHEVDNRAAQDHEAQVQALTSANSAGADAETTTSPRGVKRPATDEATTGGDNAEDEGNANDDDVEITTTADASTSNPTADPDAPPPLSKNQQRRLKRQKLWEEGHADRAAKRREKRHNKQERRRNEKAAAAANLALLPPSTTTPSSTLPAALSTTTPAPKRDRDPRHQTPVPVAIVLDCQYEAYMRDPERTSLASQVTRCYSDNRSAQRPVHLVVSSYGGALRHRYETVLRGQNAKWRGIRFAEGDFVEAAREAGELMRGEGRTVVGPLVSEKEKRDGVQGEDKDRDGDENKDGDEDKNDDAITLDAHPPTPRRGPAPVLAPEPPSVDRSVVYLTADSPYTLQRLTPHTTYVVGGLIDRNREKGLCYKVARERNVRTAKLPIGEYMVLRDRHVLATNHVVEIMLRWLEGGDWGKAFMEVIPTRKGGELRGGTATEKGEDSTEEGKDTTENGEGGGENAEKAEGSGETQGHEQSEAAEPDPEPKDQEQQASSTSKPESLPAAAAAETAE